VANIAQIETIIDRLLSKTETGSLRWDSTTGPGRYQTRLGDFVVMLQGTSGPIESAVSLEIKRLSGTSVATVSTSQLNALMTRRTSLSDQGRQKLESLFQLVSDRSSDLDELLDLL
jgi:hypothetical protein